MAYNSASLFLLVWFLQYTSIDMVKPHLLMILLPYKDYRTCITNHMGLISHHIMPLVNNSLRSRQTHTHTRMHTDFAHKSNYKKPGTHLV